MDSSGVTVVFGGGGVWGIAWLSGLAAGLARAGVDLGRAERMIGTSAGSVVGAQLAYGWSAEALYERQVDPAKQTRELRPIQRSWPAVMALATRPGLSREDRLHEMCALARTVETVAPEARRATIVERLGRGEARLAGNAAGADRGRPGDGTTCLLDARSGIGLVDAIAASCAVPGIWPPVHAGGRVYLDGGIWRTPDNAHLAEDARAALIISPMGRVPGLGDGLADEIANLRAKGMRVAAITADEASLATMGSESARSRDTRTSGRSRAKAGRR